MSKVYEIINPSDPYTIKTESPEIAKGAVLILGNGMYGLHDALGMAVLNTHFGDGLEEYAKEMTGSGPDFSAWVDSHLAELADAFDSVRIGSFGDRKFYEETVQAITEPDKLEKWIFAYKDRKRSSMNNIGLRAEKYAKHFRELAKKAVPA